jgi:hypothetical protein
MNPARSLLRQAACLAIGLGFGLALSMRASAQGAPPQGTPWLPDRQYKEGPGIKVGELELHPGIAIRGGYDNNVFRDDGKTRGGVKRDPQGAAILAVSPHLYLSTETGQRAKGGEDRGPQQAPFLSFRVGAAATYFHYFLDDAPRNVGADADFFLGIAQNRMVGLDLSADYTRSVPPFTHDAGDRKAYLFDSVQPRLRLNFRSRSQVLSAYAGYAPRYTNYVSSTFNYLNNLQHLAEVGAAWRFLPSTALIYDGTFGYQDYTSYTAADQSTILLSTSKTFRSRLGMNGALTNNLALRALAGYAVGFFNQPELDDFETGIAEVALTYRFDPHSFEIGYQRDVLPSAAGGWYQTDRGYAKIGFLLARVFALSLEGGVAHANYGRLVRIVGDTVVGLGIGNDETREDIRIDGAIRAEYRVTSWLAFMADFIAVSTITDFDYAVSASTGAQQIPDPAGFTTLQAFGGVRAHY